jgi:uncharacterized protein YdhG (YjbR/CyaY superfamily)
MSIHLHTDGRIPDAGAEHIPTRHSRRRLPPRRVWWHDEDVPAKDVDAYLAAVPKDKRAALAKLRKDIRDAAPEATEVIRYGLPTFKLDGKSLVHFGAATRHCSLYGMSRILAAHAAALKGYEVSKGTIRFPAGKPLPAALVSKLIKARVAEIKKGR